MAHGSFKQTMAPSQNLTPTCGPLALWNLCFLGLWPSWLFALCRLAFGLCAFCGPPLEAPFGPLALSWALVFGSWPLALWSCALLSPFAFVLLALALCPFGPLIFFVLPFPLCLFNLQLHFLAFSSCSLVFRRCSFACSCLGGLLHLQLMMKPCASTIVFWVIAQTTNDANDDREMGTSGWEGRQLPTKISRNEEKKKSTFNVLKLENGNINEQLGWIWWIILRLFPLLCCFG